METRYFTDEQEAVRTERELKDQGYCTLMRWTRGYKRIKITFCMPVTGSGTVKLERAPYDTATHRTR